MLKWLPVKLNILWFFGVFGSLLYFSLWHLVLSFLLFLFVCFVNFFCLSIWVCAHYFLVLLTCASCFTWCHTWFTFFTTHLHILTFLVFFFFFFFLHVTCFFSLLFGCLDHFNSFRVFSLTCPIKPVKKSFLLLLSVRLSDFLIFPRPCSGVSAYWGHVMVEVSQWNINSTYWLTAVLAH